MNTNFKVIGLTRLGIKPKSTAPTADALTTRQRGRVIWSVIFTKALVARSMVPLPPKLRCCVLRPQIRCFTTIISTCWNLTSSKLKKSEAKFKRKTWKQRVSRKRVWIRPSCIAPSWLSRDRRIKMKKSSSLGHLSC